MDIIILKSQSVIKNCSSLINWHNKCVGHPPTNSDGISRFRFENKPISESIDFKEISYFLSGIGRATIYLNGIPNKIIEGHFQNGFATGYARIFDKSGGCQVGYWNKHFPNLDVSVPNGKWAWYLKSGQRKCKEDYYICK